MKQYTVTGMSCAACSSRVEKAVSRVPGVTSCAVSLLTNSMGVEGDVPESAVIAAVEKAGYGAAVQAGLSGTPENCGSSDAAKSLLEDTQTPLLRRRLLWSIGFLLVLMYISMGHMMWSLPLPSFLSGNHIATALTQMLLALVIMLINRKFFVNGFKSCVHGAPNMDTLVALGSGISFAYSVFLLYRMTGLVLTENYDAAAMRIMHSLYFEGAAMIVTLITVGKMLEAFSKGKTTDALRNLMRLAPKTATVIRNGKELTVPVAQVHKDDKFVVRPGEHIPVDGIIEQGSSAVNEAALTGESIPVDKSAGDSVCAATVNESGFLICRAVRVGKDTTLSQIIKLVEDAAATKAPVAKTADRVSGVFVPAVMAIALVTVIAWLIAGETVSFALTRGISVLVISCPCALGLATPVAIMVGNGVGARHGILFKTSAALEETGRMRTVVLDKTGTVTKGEPSVTDVVPAAEHLLPELLQVAHALESRSNHPLAKAVMEYEGLHESAGIPVKDFTSLPGNGLSAVRENDGKRLLCGSMRFISSRLAVPQDMLLRAESLSSQGKTPVSFAAGEEFLGMIAVADSIKEDSAQAVEQLHRMGIRVVMLTGDNERTARAVGNAVGVDEVCAGVLPDGKEAVIRRLQETGKVAMVGDGINDAPALTRADIGIAVGAGEDVAVDCADVVLMHSRLTDVCAAIRLSRATLGNIYGNLFWAFFYNIALIPLAAGAYYHLTHWTMSPLLGAAAMSLSSFCVVMNALRLNLCDIRDDSRDRKIKSVCNAKEVYMADVQERIIKVEGMMCSHCEQHVKEALEKIDGVTQALADHTKNEVTVMLAKDVPDTELAEAVRKAGYEYKG